MKVYLDYGATSPIKQEVKAAIMPYLGPDFGNPSSIHSWGQVAKEAIESSRSKIAKFLGCQEKEIIFTSGGTEADNLAIRGLVLGLGSSRSLSATHSSPVSSSPSATRDAGTSLGDVPSAKKNFHIITNQIEHHAVLKTCQDLEKNGLAEITYLKPNSDGLITVDQVRKAIKKNTCLVSIMYVNNEIGTLQPIREIGKMIEKENDLRNFKIYFHTDAVQAAEYQNMDVDYLHVDLLTLSGHKIGAPKGIGMLYKKDRTPLEKIIFGGEQEMNLRAGTENVCGIVALGKAIEVLRNEKYEIRAQKVQKLRDYFIQKVLQEIPEVELNGSKDFRSPNNANFYFKYIEGESILLSLDLVGIAASSGSACTSLSLEPSHVLMAVYNHPERAHGSVRFTLGEKTTKLEIDYVIRNLKLIIKRLRSISPLNIKEK